MIRRTLAGLAVGVALLGGCAQPGPTRGTAPSNEAVMALLGTVRALHHEADVFEGAGEFERATSVVRRILSLDFPSNMAEAEDLRADAYGRLAELALRRAAPDEALSLADTGLRDTRREGVLRGRLMMVRGQSLGALADRAHAAADEPAARRYREQAVEALEASIALNQRILQRLADGGAP
jgi:hypothetical protein